MNRSTIVLLLLTAPAFTTELQSTPMEVVQKKDVSLQLTKIEKKFKAGDVLDLEYAIVNDSDKDIQFTLFFPLGYYPRITNAQTKSGCALNTPVYNGPALPKTFKVASGKRKDFKVEVRLLKKGEQWNGKEAAMLAEPGGFLIQFVIELKAHEKNDWAGTLTSNTIQIEIEE